MAITRATVKNQSLTSAMRKKGVTVIANKESCPHCAILFVKLGQHINACMMNPSRQSLGGVKVCPKCNFASTGKNFTRHAQHCDGDIDAAINKALQSYRSDYLRIARGGAPVQVSDRSLGYGNRAVPEVFRVNVENDLLSRGMPTDWSISSSLRIVYPEYPVEDEVIETKNERQVVDDDYAKVIGNVVDLIVDERTFAEVLNHIINIATYKLAKR